ncbi:hypothetical protein FRIGORI9N_450121 [Frigoribacterium sp. 9N]|nr:hypothetical protein FRIGORI9N_450121 [Frigoribacterium sp. 9N]
MRTAVEKRSSPATRTTTASLSAARADTGIDVQNTAVSAAVATNAPIVRRVVTISFISSPLVTPTARAETGVSVRQHSARANPRGTEQAAPPPGRPACHPPGPGHSGREPRS